MGDIFGTQSVMYKNVTSYYDIFVRVHKNKIIMGKIGTDGTDSVVTAMQMESEVLLGSKDEESSFADRAVDELLEVIKKLAQTGMTMVLVTHDHRRSDVCQYRNRRADLTVYEAKTALPQTDI